MTTKKLLHSVATVSKLELVEPRIGRLAFRFSMMDSERDGRILAPFIRVLETLGPLHEHRPVSFSCSSGTIVGFEYPDKPLGPEIRSIEDGKMHVFPVPKKYQGLRNAAIVSIPGDYALRPRGRNTYVDASKVDVVEDIPRVSGTSFFFLTDPKHGIPRGNEVPPDTKGSVSVIRPPCEGVVPLILANIYQPAPGGTHEEYLLDQPLGRIGTGWRVVSMDGSICSVHSIALLAQKR